MKLPFSEKTNLIDSGIFGQLNEKQMELKRKGKTIYNLSVGTPDFLPAEHVMKALTEASKKPENYKYSLRDLPELIQAVQFKYQNRYHITLEEEEITSVYGSQEGLTHIGFALCNPDDYVLIPNPGYPIFKIGPYLCGAKIYEYPLLAENNFLPDLSTIPENIAQKAKCMIVSYPANPVCVTAPDSFYQDLIAFAHKYQIIVIHDNAYSDIVYDGSIGKSFLSYSGAKEIGIEFYSLSKSFNLTGARISFAVGNQAIIQAFKKIRSQIDYGIFLPVQYAAIAALTGPDEAVKQQCEIYKDRNHTLCSGFRQIGWEVPDSKGTMFVWAPLPKHYKSSEQFCVDLIEKSGVVCVPGTSFGSLGEGYVRLALVLEASELKKAVEAIQCCGIVD